MRCFTLWFYNVFKTTGRIKKKDDKILRKITEEKQICVTITIFLGGKETVFPVKLKLEGENCLNKDITKDNFKKDLMYLTRTNY